MREDWIECKIGDVFNFLGGGTPSTTNERYWNGDIPWASIKDIKGDFLNSTINKITNEGLTNSASNLVAIDEVILATRINPGRPIISKINTSINQDLKVVKPKLELPSVFVFYLFKFLEKEIIGLSSGTTVLGIGLNPLKDIKFSIPPLPEQRAIVKKLERLFSCLYAGVADLKKAQQQLKIYRQAVLKKAFESDTIVSTVGEYFSFLGGGTPSKQNKAYWNGNINWASIKDIKGDVLNNTIDYITEEGLNNSSSNLAERDEVILATRINPGKTIISNIRTAINQDLKVIKPFQKCDHKYVHYLFKSIEHKCLKVSSGTTVLGISLPNLKEIEIPFEKDINKQAQIVKQIESRLSVCDSIEQNIKESLEKAEALRQSILKKAFEGNLLTAQELAECKLAEDYEPAGVLLERIKADYNKVTAKPSKKIVATPIIVAKQEMPIVKVSTDIHAGLIAKVVKLHEENPALLDKLSHIKCEKIAHLVEFHLQISLGRQPVKDAAGPDDYSHLKKVEHRAKMAGYFAIKKKQVGYSYSSTKNSDKAVEKLQSVISDEKNKQLDNLIALFLNFDLEVAEIIATTYAGWNNLLISGNTNPSDEEIVYESRENWSERKLSIARERFFKAIDWMRKNELVPTGYGTVIPFPKKKK